MTLTRRKLVQGTAAAAAAGTLGARHIAAQTPAPAPGEIVIPDPQVELPTEDVTFRWIDSGDLKALFYAPFHEKYMEKHPNITIQYDPLPWSEVNQIVPLGVQGGNAHDMFAMPQPVPTAQAVAEGWVAPIDDLIPNFEEWKAKFPLGSFMDGVHVFDGRTYTFPQTSSKRYWTMSFTNNRMMEEAGVDPNTERLTWDTFRETCRKVTENGGGEYYGMIIGGGGKERLADFVRNFGRMAGASASSSVGVNDIDFRTGDFVYTSDQYVAAVELLLAINADGSLFPGSMSLQPAEAWSMFPQEVAGIILEGPWVIPQWQRDAPDFGFSITSQPLPNDTVVPMTYQETGANQIFVYAESPYKNIAGDLMHYMGTVEGQVSIMAATGGNLRAVVPEAVEIALATVDLDPVASAALALYDEQLRLGPMPTIRNPEVTQVAFELDALSPDLGEIVQGLLVGSLSDARAALEDLQSRANSNLDAAIASAVEKGAQVSRDDFIFSDWDPTQDFTAEMYS